MSLVAGALHEILLAMGRKKSHGVPWLVWMQCVVYSDEPQPAAGAASKMASSDGNESALHGGKHA